MKQPSSPSARTFWIVLAAGMACSNTPPPRPRHDGLRPRPQPEATARPTPPPTSAPAPPEAPARTLAAACSRTCAVVAGGAVWCWARPPGAQADGLSPTVVAGVSEARSLACGGGHCCATLRGGAVTCWSLPPRARPVGAPSVLALPAGDEVASLSVGGAGVCAVLRAGRVVCWRPLARDGIRFSGAQRVAGIEGARAVAVGGAHACAIVGEGRVRCWGGSREGQAGVVARAVAEDAPAEVANLPSAVELTAGERHTCARTAGGEVWCWGDNRSGQLGCGPFAGGPRPQRAVDLLGAESIAAGSTHGCALLPGGAVACWGDNRARAIGAIDPRSAPVPVAIPGVTAAQVSASCDATCARRSDGAVHCWGAGYRAAGDAPGRPVFVSLPQGQ